MEYLQFSYINDIITNIGLEVMDMSFLKKLIGITPQGDVCACVRYESYCSPYTCSAGRGYKLMWKEVDCYTGTVCDSGHDCVGCV